MDLLAPPEEQIRATLSRFVADEEGGSDTRRRLFADDTVNGLRLLEISEQRFDVLLMNPPFGAIADLFMQPTILRSRIAEIFILRSYSNT